MTSPTPPEEKDDQNIVCPFCHDNDFDLMGLKYHLMNGYCEVFNDTKDIRRMKL